MGVKEWGDLLMAVTIALTAISNHLLSRYMYKLEARIKALEEKEN